MTNLYQPVVDEWFLSKYENRPPDGRFHPSSLAGCDRLAVYEVSGTEPTDEKDVRNIRIMGNGTDIHADVQYMAQQEWPGTLIEVEVDWGPIKGSADALRPVAYESGALWGGAIYELQEYKSIGPNGKRWLKGPKPEHVKQARIYHAGLMQQGYELTYTIRIVYFDRDDWSVVEFEVEPWDDREVINFLGGVYNLGAHVEEGTLPPRMPLDAKGQRFWLCRYCQFRTRCWDVDRESERG